MEPRILKHWGVLTIQYFSQFFGKAFHGKWFLDKPLAAPSQDGTGLTHDAIAAGEKNLYVQLECLDAVISFPATHAGHDHVQNHNVDTISIGGIDFKGLFTAAGS